MVCCTHTQSEMVLKTVQEHKASISDLQTSKDHTMVITACKDTSAKVKPLLTIVAERESINFWQIVNDNIIIHCPLFCSYLMPTNFNSLKRTRQNVQSIQHLYRRLKIM